MKKITFLLITFALTTSAFQATNLFWTGANSNNWNDNLNWSASSGGPSVGVIPTNLDVAIFDAGGNISCNININANALGITILAGYTATLTQNNGFSLTIDSLYNQTNGVFIGGDSNIDINGTFTYTPNLNFNGNDTVVVQICDAGTPLPSLCVNDTIFITVTPVNDPPSKGNETMTILEDDPATTSPTLITNNVDPDGTPTTITAIVSTTGGGTAFILAGDSTISYTPILNFNGIDTVIYTVCDTGLPMPIVCVNDTLFVTVNPVNDPPSKGNETMTVTEDDPATTSPILITNNVDPDGTTTIVFVVVNTTAGGGTVITGSGTTIDYTPPIGFIGIDTVIYTVCDAGIPLPPECVNDTLFINVVPKNRPPVATDDLLTVPEDSTVIINVQINDSDPDVDPLTTTVIGGPTSGGIAAVLNGDSLGYTPPINFVGNDTITYMVCDTAMPSLCDTAVVFITVVPVIDTLLEVIPMDSTITICADSLTNFGVPATSITMCSLPSHGSTTITGTCVEYIPSSGFLRMDTLCLISCNGSLCDTSIVIITITPTDTDGDGDLDPTDPDPTDPCVWSTNQDVTNTSTTWNTTDCDGDGVTNADEVNGLDGNPLTTTDNTDPTDPCSFNKESITLTITNTTNCLFVPDGFSPNGDGVNDVFVITGLETYPNHKLLILNRWGNKVYEAGPYNNDWKGMDEFGITIGGIDLPVGTYFYILELGDDSDALKGYLYLNR